MTTRNTFRIFTKRGVSAHAANARQFERLMAMNNDVEFWQPRPLEAPWHVQAQVNGTIMNFWPHLLKGNIGGEAAVVGYRKLQSLIGRARAGDDPDLIEEDDGGEFPLARVDGPGALWYDQGRPRANGDTHE